jgi:hypothetical protein
MRSPKADVRILSSQQQPGSAGTIAVFSGAIAARLKDFCGADEIDG